MKGTHEQTLSSVGEKLLHKPGSLQKCGTNSDMVLYRAAKPQLVKFSQPVVTDMIDREQILLIGDGGQKKGVTDSVLIGQDLWKQLKRVTIPVFSGENKMYQN